MKKVLFILTVIAILGFQPAIAQEGGLKLGANLGLPVGDADDFTTFNVGVDVAYLFDATESFKAGPLVGYTHFFGENAVDLGFGEVDFEDVQFVPVAASGRYYFAENFFGGADLGYAINISDTNGESDGGFYYRPKVGYSFGMANLQLSFQGIAVDDTTFSSVNVGAEFEF